MVNFLVQINKIGNSEREKKYLTDLKEQEKVEDIFLVLSAQKLMAKNGPYWQLVLQDKSGQMQARIWSPLSLQLEEIAPESFFGLEEQCKPLDRSYS